ncbi:214_t:CDS:1 [Ambispora gerdemannii]|uniref:214_t:CDS:1 n=1 Tax=Ambispora gerdemannii TaxID=144530 RepID=A0A9N9CA67_9GLOM|nr:214_t:CDS:1 [Ambispora gerdemannii]
MDRKLQKVAGRKTPKRLFYIGSAYLRMGIKHRPLSRSRRSHNNNDHFMPLPLTPLTPPRLLEEGDKGKLANYSNDTDMIEVAKIIANLQDAVVSRDSSIVVVVDNKYVDDDNRNDIKGIKKSKDNDDVIMNDADFIEKDNVKTASIFDVSNNNQISSGHIDASMEVDIVANSNNKKIEKNIVQINHYYKTRKSSKNSKNINDTNVQQKIEANKNDKIENTDDVISNINNYMNSSISESSIGKKEVDVLVEEKNENNHQDESEKNEAFTKVDERVIQHKRKGQEPKKEHEEVAQEQKKGEIDANQDGDGVTKKAPRYELRPRKYNSIIFHLSKNKPIPKTPYDLRSKEKPRRKYKRLVEYPPKLKKISERKKKYLVAQRNKNNDKVNFDSNNSVVHSDAVSVIINNNGIESNNNAIKGEEEGKSEIYNVNSNNDYNNLVTAVINIPINGSSQDTKLTANIQSLSSPQEQPQQTDELHLINKNDNNASPPNKNNNQKHIHDSNIQNSKSLSQNIRKSNEKTKTLIRIPIPSKQTRNKKRSLSDAQKSASSTSPSKSVLPKSSATTTTTMIKPKCPKIDLSKIVSSPNISKTDTLPKESPNKIPKLTDNNEKQSKITPNKKGKNKKSLKTENNSNPIPEVTHSSLVNDKVEEFVKKFTTYFTLRKSSSSIVASEIHGLMKNDDTSTITDEISNDAISRIISRVSIPRDPEILLTIGKWIQAQRLSQSRLLASKISNLISNALSEVFTFDIINLEYSLDSNQINIIDEFFHHVGLNSELPLKTVAEEIIKIIFIAMPESDGKETDRVRCYIQQSHGSIIITAMNTWIQNRKLKNKKSVAGENCNDVESDGMILKIQEIANMIKEGTSITPNVTTTTKDDTSLSTLVPADEVNNSENISSTNNKEELMITNHTNDTIVVPATSNIDQGNASNNSSSVPIASGIDVSSLPGESLADEDNMHVNFLSPSNNINNQGQSIVSLNDSFNNNLLNKNIFITSINGEDSITTTNTTEATTSIPTASLSLPFFLKNKNLEISSANNKIYDLIKASRYQPYQKDYVAPSPHLKKDSVTNDNNYSTTIVCTVDNTLVETFVIYLSIGRLLSSPITVSEEICKLAPANTRSTITGSTIAKLTSRVLNQIEQSELQLINTWIHRERILRTRDLIQEVVNLINEPMQQLFGNSELSRNKNNKDEDPSEFIVKCGIVDEFFKWYNVGKDKKGLDEVAKEIVQIRKNSRQAFLVSANGNILEQGANTRYETRSKGINNSKWLLEAMRKWNQEQQEQVSRR